MITASAFFSESLATVDAVIGDFVSKVYTNLVHENVGVISLLFTFYVMMIGYRFLVHPQSENISSVIRNLIVMLCVYGLLMRWDLYNLFIYKVFTKEPGEIAQVLVSATGSHESVAEGLDKIYKAIVTAAIGFFSQVNFSSSGVKVKIPSDSYPFCSYGFTVSLS